jgi:hypothetical protein
MGITRRPPACGPKAGARGVPSRNPPSAYAAHHEQGTRGVVWDNPVTGNVTDVRPGWLSQSSLGV